MSDNQPSNPDREIEMGKLVNENAMLRRRVNDLEMTLQQTIHNLASVADQISGTLSQPLAPTR